jgi:hypothetical protein
MSNITIIAPEGTTITQFVQGSPQDPAVIAAGLQASLDAAIAERDANATALATMTAERDVLLARIEANKLEQDEAIAAQQAALAEQQDARTKLGGA